MAGSLTVRPVEPADSPEWLRMLLALRPEGSEAEHAAEIAAFHEGVAELLVEVFVCERDDRSLCGFLELSVRNYAEGCEGATPFVEGWFVDPDMRRRGVGAALMDAAVRWARARGYRELASDAELSNRLSHEAHRALGFEEVVRLVSFRRPISPGSDVWDTPPVQRGTNGGSRP